MSLNSLRLPVTLALALAAGLLVQSETAFGQTQRSFNGSVSGDWRNINNWTTIPSASKWAGLFNDDPGTVLNGDADDLAFFGTTARSTVSIQDDVSIGQLGAISFNTSNAYQIQAFDNAKTLRLSGLLVNTSTGALDSSSSRYILVLASGSNADVTFSAGAGTGSLAVGIDINTSSNQAGVFVGSGRTMTVNSVISGSTALKGIALSGGGTLVLAGSNIYGGTTTLNSGTIRIAVDSLGGVGNITSSGIGKGGLALNGGTLSSGSTAARTILNAYTVGGDVTLGNATNSGALTFSAAGTLTGSRTLTIDSSVTLSGALGESTPGIGALTKLGSGTLTLSGTNAYTGATAINAGTLIVSSGDAISDAGQVSMLTGATLQLNNDERIGSLSGAGTVNLGTRTLTVGDSNDTTFAGSINGTGNLTKQGDGDLILTGTNNFSGVTTVNGGRLVGNALNLGGTKQVNTGAILEFNQSSNATFSGDINGTGAVWKTGGGALTLNGGNLNSGYSGNIAVNEGKLELASATAMSAGFISVANTATLDVDGTLTTSGLQIQLGGNLAGAGTIVGNVQVVGSVGPGNSPGTLSINGGLQLEASALLNFELNETNQGVGFNDRIAINGDLILDGTLNVTDALNPANTTWNTSGTFASPTTWTLFTFTGSLTDNGLVLGTLPTLTGTPSPQQWRLNIVYGGAGSGGSVNLQAVPEPSAALVLGGLLAGAACLRRRRVA